MMVIYADIENKNLNIFQLTFSYYFFLLRYKCHDYVNG